MRQRPSGCEPVGRCWRRKKERGREEGSAHAAEAQPVDQRFAGISAHVFIDDLQRVGVLGHGLQVLCDRVVDERVLERAASAGQFFHDTELGVVEDGECKTGHEESPSWECVRRYRVGIWAWVLRLGYFDWVLHGVSPHEWPGVCYAGAVTERSWTLCRSDAVRRLGKKFIETASCPRTENPAAASSIF